MTIPQININGTKASVLIERLLDARSALEIAIKKLEETAPHGRDYFHLIQCATTEHVQRVEVLTKMRDELDEMAMTIDLCAMGV